MRLIDADALTKQYQRMMDYDQNYAAAPISWVAAFEELIDSIENAPTFDVFQKLWNVLYAEEDKFEKRYISTPEHDNWFLFYRPWLQNGFEIAIKVLSEIFVSEPPKEENDGNCK